MVSNHLEPSGTPVGCTRASLSQTEKSSFRPFSSIAVDDENDDDDNEGEYPGDDNAFLLLCKHVCIFGIPMFSCWTSSVGVDFMISDGNHD